MNAPNFGERTLQDFSQWSKLGGIYVEFHPKEEGMIRTSVETTKRTMGRMLGKAN